MNNELSRDEKLCNLYIKLLDSMNDERERFDRLQKEAFKVGAYRNKYNYGSYDLTCKNIMSCVIRMLKLKEQLEVVSKKVGLPF